MDQASYKELGGFFTELAPSRNMIAEITAEKQVHHQVNCVSVLKGKVDIDDELRLDYFEVVKLFHH